MSHRPIVSPLHVGSKCCVLRRGNASTCCCCLLLYQYAAPAKAGRGRSVFHATYIHAQRASRALSSVSRKKPLVVPFNGGGDWPTVIVRPLALALRDALKTSSEVPLPLAVCTPPCAHGYGRMHACTRARVCICNISRALFYTPPAWHHGSRPLLLLLPALHTMCSEAEPQAAIMLYICHPRLLHFL